MPDFGIFRGFGSKLFSDKMYAGQLPTQLGLIGSERFGFLLDVYPNAAAAYSLRRLRTAYTGSAIRVRRASDNTEQDIGFVSNELDTSTLTSFCSGTNGFVKTWYDQSGNGYDATQSTAANQPQIVSFGSVILDNGKPSLKFDGSNDFYSIGDLMSNSTSSSGFFVAKANLATSASKNTMHDIGTTDDTHLKYINNITYDGYSSTVRKNWTDSVNYSLRNLIAITSKTNLYNFTVNNNSVYNTTTNTFNKKSTNLLGKGPNPSYWDGNFQEIILYASEQYSDLNGINTNINSFYSIY